MAIATHPVESDWAAALERVLSDPRRIRVVYQPIADLRRGDVCGYEALARFPDLPDVSPLAWFQAAAELGCAGALEAEVVGAALTAWPLLGKGRFVSVNVSPAALLAPEVQRALAAEQRHDRLVVELGAPDGSVPSDLHGAAKELSRAGVALAVTAFEENVGLSPRYVKVPVERLADAEICKSPGTDLIVQRVETDEQLEMVRRIGPSLVQGFVLARPAPAPGVADASVRRLLSR